MKRILKWLGIIIGGLLGLVLIAYLIIAQISRSRLNRTYEVTADFNLDVSHDPESVAEGERLYTILCQSCHGEDLAGTTFSDFMFGQLQMANLTSGAGGIGSSHSDEDIARAVWYGVKPDGSPTFFMAPELSPGITVEDMAQIIAYIRSVPPMDTTPVEMRPGPMARVMHATNQMPLVTAETVEMDAPPRSNDASEDVLALGERWATFCTACHGADFTGNSMIGSPNITPHETAVGGWTEAEFARAIREGVRPDGSTISTEMPWETMSRYSDEEIHAIWTYLQTVEPVAREQ
ncbi:c-type cytochrome [Candidatus Leptofilum sp.]|uniref:c-type cytochrome n=1 Tax=Candidatus Leptofilum sp. TaxID=3241576 RepID=UPI003B5A96C8